MMRKLKQPADVLILKSDIIVGMNLEAPCVVGSAGFFALRPVAF